ncbi:MAG: methyltransferase domain-containing protein [Nitrospirales bacterium]|nr:methyltransferase domain-containing protein [Nitrospirales bacterium]
MMDRRLEPEIMDGEEQARVYAAADFAKENQDFVEQFVKTYDDMEKAFVLDLGCGPGDILIRLARCLPELSLLGLDASPAMIRLAEDAVKEAGFTTRITLHCQRFQDFTPPALADAIISNSMLHHIPNPLQFWYAVKTMAKPRAPVFVMDLLRPDSPETAQSLVDQYAAEEPEQLRHDFYYSLLSAFTEDEVAAQLAELNFSRLFIDVPDDRHWMVYGRT